MKLGQKVMLIVVFNFDSSWGAHIVPPIGTIGEISKEIDEYDEYDVLFEDFPHPAINDPAWIVHKTEIIPIYDDGILNEEKESDILFA